MAIQISISNAIGSRYRGSVVPPVDPDAQAFITAASITDPTQQAAINTLVVDLKGYNIWSKMKALYPFVGSTASQQKFNLKDPRDLDAAFRLVFSGGWNHSNLGATPNGVNAFANTYFNPIAQSSALQSFSISFYSRTNSNAGNAFDIGSATVWGSGYQATTIATRYNNNNTFIGIASTYTQNAETDSRGFYLAGTNGSTTRILYKNGVNTFSGTSAQDGFANRSLYIGAINDNGLDNARSNKQTAFAHIGDGLSPTEAANFYTAVQAFQTTLGRSIGTQTVSDADAQAFVTAAGIVDQVEANAINNLVIGMKADGIWTKMKAVYPFVGGTSTTNKYNLKNPLDTDAAFRLVFNGGITHSSTGVKGNGVNAYFDTWIIPSDLFTSVSGGSMFCYIRNNTQTGSDLGAFQPGVNYRMQLLTRNTSNEISGAALSNNFILEANSDSRGFWGVTRPASSGTYHLIKNTTSSSNTDSYFEPNAYLKGLALGIDLTSQIIYSDHELAFVCVADGLTTTEAQTLRTINLTFQTTLSRNV